MYIFEKGNPESLKGLQKHIGTVSETSAAISLVHMHNLAHSHKEMLDKADSLYQKSADQLPDDALENRTQHGVHMAKAITAHLKEKYPEHDIHEVHLTSGPGDISKATKGIHNDTAQENPSDVTIGLKHKKTGKVIYHGISLKSSEGGDIGFKNPTPKHMDAALGTNANEMHKNGDAEFAKNNKIDHLPYKSPNGKDRKSAIENTPGLKEKAKEHFGSLFNKVRDHIVDHVSNVLKTDEGQSKVKKFYAQTYVNSDVKHGALPYSKVTAMGNEKKGITVKTDEPTENRVSQLLNDPKTKLTVHAKGNGYIHTIAHHPDHEHPIHLFSEQVKTSSGAGYSSPRHNIQPPSGTVLSDMKNITR